MPAPKKPDAAPSDSAQAELEASASTDATRSNESESAESNIAPEPSGVSLAAPDGATACSVDDHQYAVVDGRVSVAEKHVARLLEAGFRLGA